MEYLDPIQRYSRIEPLFSKHNRDYGESQSDGSGAGFDDYLEDALEDTDSLPDDLERSFLELTRFRVHTEEELFIMAMNFSQHGVQLMHDINLRVLPNSFEAELLEKELLKVANALFILIVQYGIVFALQALCDLWKSIQLTSRMNHLFKSHLMYIASSRLPLLPYQQSRQLNGGVSVEEKDQQLKEFLKDILIHRIVDEKAKPILESFRD